MRLSGDFGDLANKPDEVWDVVVVGSGYGAGVSAARLAESGADGSVVPTSLGVNPLLTITSLSERIAEHIATDLGLVPRASSAIA